MDNAELLAWAYRIINNDQTPGPQQIEAAKVVATCIQNQLLQRLLDKAMEENGSLAAYRQKHLSSVHRRNAASIGAPNAQVH